MAPSLTSPRGDEVLHSKYGGTEIGMDEARSLVLREADVLARSSGTRFLRADPRHM